MKTFRLARCQPLARTLLLLLGFAALPACQSTGGTSLTGGTAIHISRDAKFALNKLYSSTPGAKALASQAKGVLVFPSIVKGGFLFGAQYGTGTLLKKGRNAGYYNTVAASYGLQAGVESFGYVLMFMSDSALRYLDESDGWEIGAGPSIVIVDAGAAQSLTTTTAKSDVYAFIFDQKGLMAGLTLQGSKISKIHPQ